MFCSACGTQLQQQSAFCHSCGAKISTPGSVPPPSLSPQPPPLPRQPARQTRKAADRVGIIIAVVLGLIGFVSILGIVAAIAVPNFLNAVQRGKQKRTVADIRAIAGAVEAYYVEHHQYPQAESMAQLAELLQPKYIKTMPKNDAWEHQFRYNAWKANDVTSAGYAIGSGGKDGAWEEEDLRSYPHGRGENFNSDIVFLSGEFIQQPDLSYSASFSSTQSSVGSVPGPPIAFPQYNFRFQKPPKPWVQMDARKVNKSSNIAFMRSQPQVLFFLIAENLQEGTMDTAALAEISKGNLRSAANSVEILQEGEYVAGNHHGIRFISKANIGGNDMMYVHWVCSAGPHAYQLITVGEFANAETIKKEAQSMLGYFELMN